MIVLDNINYYSWICCPIRILLLIFSINIQPLLAFFICLFSQNQNMLISAFLVSFDRFSGLVQINYKFQIRIQKQYVYNIMEKKKLAKPQSLANTNLQFEIQLKNHLGGVHLYNEQYARHIAQKTSQNTKTTEMNPGLKIQIVKDTYLEEIEDYEMGRYIKDHLDQKKQFQQKNLVIFTQEIQGIISSFKETQANTSKFLQEIKRRHLDQEKLTSYDIEELYRTFMACNSSKYSKLISKLNERYSRKVNQQFDKVKLEKKKQQEQNIFRMRQFATQTPYDDYEKELTSLKKEKEKLKVQYDTLFQYKKNFLSEEEVKFGDLQIKHRNQKLFIAKLQTQIASKNIILRNIQIQLKQAQEKLKVIQSQRIDYTFPKFQPVSNNNLSEQSESKQIVQEFINVFGKKKRKKKRSRNESIFSVAKSLFSNRKSVISFEDFARSMSQMRISTQPSESDEEFLKTLSKMPVQKQKLFKILQEYNKSLFKLQTINSLKQFKKHNRIMRGQLSFEKKNQVQRRKSRFREKLTEKGQEIEKEKRGKQRKMIICETGHKNSRSIQDQAWKKNLQNIYQQTKSPERIIHHNHLEANNDQIKKIRKKVSFKFSRQNERTKKYKIMSNQINICISNNNHKPKLNNHIQVQETKIASNVLQRKFNSKANFIHNQQKKYSNHKKFNSLFNLQSLGVYTENRKENKKFKKIQIKTAVNDLNGINIGNQRLSFQSTLKLEQTVKICPNQRNTFSFLTKFNQNSTKAQKQLQRVTKMARICSNKEQYIKQVKICHNMCRENCQHIKKYIEIFDKIRSKSKQALKLNVQNVNSHL